MQTDAKAEAARKELGAAETLAVHLYGLTAVVRSLYQSHPDKDQVRALFEQLEGQILAAPAFVTNEARRIVLKDFAATVFQPPVVLDK